MVLQLHEWLDKFISVHELDTDVEHTNNTGLFMLHSLIHEERNGIYKKHYPNLKCFPLIEWMSFDHKTRTEYDFEAMSDFVYERATGYVLINFRSNSSLPHENFMAALYNAIENKDLNGPEGAEAYIEKYGFSLSSVSYHKEIIIGQNFSLNAQEKIAFRAYNFIR